MFIIRFVFKLIKGILILIGIGTVVWGVLQYKQVNSPLRRTIEKARQSGIVEEGIKDVKTWGGEIFQDSKIGDDITSADKKRLDDILAKELGVKKKDDKDRRK